MFALWNVQTSEAWKNKSQRYDLIGLYFWICDVN